MVKYLKSIDGSAVITFTLDKPQPVKHPMFMDYPVAGVLQVGGNGVKAGQQSKRVTIKNYKDLNSILYNRAVRLRAL